MSEETRKIAAILFSDIVGYTAAMGRDEEAAIRAVSRSRAVQKEFVRKNRGVWLQEIGDGAMCTFDSAVEAVRCAVEIQRAFAEDPDFRLRIGIHVGDLVFRKTDVGTDIFGDAVNVAARVQGVADAGGICISERVYDDMRNKGFQCVFIGEKELKNVNRPIRVYRVVDPEHADGAVEAEAAASEPASGGARGPLRWLVPLAAASLAAAVASVWFFSGSEAPVAPESHPAPAAPEAAAALPPAERLPAPAEPEGALAEESVAVAALPPPAPPASDAFRAALGGLMGAVGPWTDVGARVWTEPDPVPNNETYVVRFQADCDDCAALLFAVDGSHHEIALLYPNPYELAEPLAPGAVRQVPSSPDRYTLRAVGGQGMDMLKLIVVSGDPGFPSTTFQSWEATPGEPARIAELEAFLESLGGRPWGTAETPLHIAR